MPARASGARASGAVGRAGWLAAVFELANTEIICIRRCSLRRAAPLRGGSSAAQTNGTSRRGRIDRHAPLRHLDLASRHEPPRGGSGRLHQRPPVVLSANPPRGLRRTDRRGGGALREERKDGILELRVHRPHAAPSARIAAVTDRRPFARPFLAPRDASAASDARLVAGR